MSSTIFAGRKMIGLLQFMIMNGTLVLLLKQVEYQPIYQITLLAFNKIQEVLGSLSLHYIASKKCLIEQSGRINLFLPCSILFQISFSINLRAFRNQAFSLPPTIVFCFNNKLGNHCYELLLYVSSIFLCDRTIL